MDIVSEQVSQWVQYRLDYWFEGCLWKEAAFFDGARLPLDKIELMFYYININIY
jgi:hypothetical protein